MSKPIERKCHVCGEPTFSFSNFCRKCKTEKREAGERRVTYQHDDTGNIFTKLIPAGEPIPEFPRRFIISVEIV